MSAVLGMWLWVVLILTAVMIGLAVVLVRRRSRRHRYDRDEVGSDSFSSSRLAMVESTEIDDGRRLVLVRCDDVEHLVMVGGPVDLVIENDVRKSRAARTAAKAAPAEIPQRRPVAPAPEAPEVASSAVAKQPDPVQPAKLDDLKRVPRSEAPERAPRPTLTAVPPPFKNGASGVAPAIRPAAAAEAPRVPAIAAPRRAEPPAPRPASDAPVPRDAEPHPVAAELAPDKPRPRIVERLLGWRDAAASALPGSQQPQHEPDPEVQPEEPRRRRSAPPPAPAAVAERGRAGGETVRQAVADNAEPREPRRPALIAPADTSWAEPDSLEGEIVRALSANEDQAPEQLQTPAPRPAALAAEPAAQPVSAAAAVERPAQPPVAASPPPPAAAAAEAKGPVNPATTLGDLAERLEEALAREVKAANQNRTPAAAPGPDAFGFRTDAPPQRPEFRQSAPPTVRALPEPERPAEAERTMPRPAPEPERREARAQAERQPERQDEAPVINLNTRRREAADPLEDEMARLLGELTGDTTRR